MNPEITVNILVVAIEFVISIFTLSHPLPLRKLYMDILL